MVLAKVRLAAEKLTAGAVPVPVSATVCGEPDALSVKLTAADSAPVAVGLNPTVMMQLAAAARLAPQVLVCEKELALVPVIEIPLPLRLSAPVPVFLSVIFCAVAPVLIKVPENESEVGDKLTAGAVPVPLRVTFCGEPVALSAMRIVAVSVPAAAGVKVTVMAQLAPAPRLALQLFTCENEPAPVPEMPMPWPVPLKVSVAVPVFFSVMACVAALLPTSVPANVRLVAERLTAGAVPVPDSVIFCGEPLALSAMFIAAVSAPATAGLKLTVMVQLPPAATLDPQLLVCAYALALVPVTVMAALLKVSGAFPVLLSVTGSVAVVPTAVALNERLPGDKPAAGASPVPLRVTFCGDPAALSAMLSAAAREPKAVGLKVTVMAQLPFAATLAPHLLVCENEVALVPEMLIAVLLNVSGALPVLVNVTVCVAVEPTAVFAKFRLVAGRLTAAPVPTPLSETVCGEPEALSAMLSVAVSAPMEAGLKVTVIAHVALIARAAVQVLVCVKELSPLMDTGGLVHVSAAVPELVTVIFCVAAYAPTVVLAKVRLPADRLTAGTAANPVPDKVTVCGEPTPLSATVTAPANEPVAAGLKVTVILQVPFAATPEAHVLVCVNDVALVPVMETPFTVSAALPVVLSTMTWVAAVMPCVVEGKVSADGVKLTAGGG